MKLKAVRKMEAEKQHSLIKSLELIVKFFEVEVKKKRKKTPQQQETIFNKVTS